MMFTSITTDTGSAVRPKGRYDMAHVLDTDFSPEDRIIVYAEGKVLYEDKVEFAGEGLKRFCDRCDWYQLAAEEEHDFLFVGGAY